ncbi:unnamed protein product [Cercospora beticola]|nr:unnamed protein product [Cercospora beticola]
MSRSFSTIPPDGFHAGHLQHAIMAFKNVPGRMGLFWQCTTDIDTTALNQICRFLVAEILSPQRLETLPSVYDPAVYNLDALTCMPCANARLGHCDIASQPPGTHCTNCILWRKDSCDCNNGLMVPLMEALVAQAETRPGQPLTPPKDYTVLAADERQQHTRDFCERHFGVHFEWPQAQPPSPQMPLAIQNNALGLAGKDLREKVKARKQQKQAKRKENAAIFGKHQRNGQDPARKSGSPTAKYGRLRKQAIVVLPLGQADPLPTVHKRPWNVEPGTSVIVQKDGPALSVKEHAMASAGAGKRKLE